MTALNMSMGSDDLGIDVETLRPQNVDQPNPVFPSEIFAIILSFLRKPIPVALSSPPASELNHPDLCTASLVCKDFQAICSPLLYTHIVAGDACSLLKSIVAVSAKAGVFSRFHWTKSLRLEYLEKGREFSYTELFRISAQKSEGKRGGPWARFGMTRDEADNAELSDCYYELYDLENTLYGLIGLTLASLCPALETIAIAPAMGKGGVAWSEYDTAADEYGKSGKLRVRDVAHLFRNVLITASPFLTRVCVSNCCGPLSLPLDPIPTPAICPTTNHFGYYWFMDMPITFGSPTTWMYSDCSVPKIWDELAQHSINKRILAYSHYRSQNFPDQPIDLTIYCSTDKTVTSGFDVDRFLATSRPDLWTPMDGYPQILTPFLQRAMASKLEIARRKIFSDAQPDTHKHIKDIIRWMISADTPICQACGAGPPARSDGIPRIASVEEREMVRSPSTTILAQQLTVS